MPLCALRYVDSVDHPATDSAVAAAAVEMAQQLVVFGAERDAVDENGRSAVEGARRSRKEELAQFLEAVTASDGFGRKWSRLKVAAACRMHREVATLSVLVLLLLLVVQQRYIYLLNPESFIYSNLRRCLCLPYVFESMFKVWGLLKHVCSQMHLSQYNAGTTRAPIKIRCWHSQMQFKQPRVGIPLPSSLRLFPVLHLYTNLSHRSLWLGGGLLPTIYADGRCINDGVITF